MKDNLPNFKAVKTFLLNDTLLKNLIGANRGQFPVLYIWRQNLKAEQLIFFIAIMHFFLVIQYITPLNYFCPTKNVVKTTDPCLLVFNIWDPSKD